MALHDDVTGLSVGRRSLNFTASPRGFPLKSWPSSRARTRAGASRTASPWR
jgi:hypothetical protein